MMKRGAFIEWRSLASTLAVAGFLSLLGAALPADAQINLPNAGGEACRAAPATNRAADPGAPLPHEIFCGKETKPVTLVVASVMPLTVPAESGPARQAALEKAIAASPMGKEWQAGLVCQPGQWTKSAAGFESRLASCTMSTGGWPNIAVAAPVGNFLLMANGSPSLLAPIEATILAMTGQAAAPAELAADAAARTRAIKGDAGEMHSGDLKAYEAMMQTARLHNSTENHAEAEKAYRRALQLQVRALGSDAAGLGDTLIHLALEVSNQGRFEEAAGLFRRAEPLIGKSPNPGDRARFTVYQAYDASNRRAFDEAVQFAKESTALRRGQLDKSAGPAGTTDLTDEAIGARGELAHSLITEATMNYRLGDYSAAEVNLVEALQLLGETPGLPIWWRPQAQLLLGEVQSFQGRSDAAERNIIGALSLRRRLFGDTLPTASALMVLGRYYSREQFHERAVDAFKAGLEIIERSETGRSELSFDRIIPYFDSARAVAEKDVARRPELEADIFRASQLINAGVADQTIARASIRLAAADPVIAELVRETQEAQRTRDTAQVELAFESSQPDDRRGRIREDQLEAELKSASAKLAELNKRLQEAFPDYAKLANPGPLELAELRKVLAPDEAFLTLNFGSTAGYGILVRANGFAAVRLDMDADMANEAVTTLRRAFAVRVGTLDAFDLRESYALYRRLLAPFMNQLGDVRHLAVAAGGPLASLPLAVLVTEPPAGNQDYRNAAWLNRKFALSQVPSGRALVALRSIGRGSAAKRPMLGIGNPTFIGTPQGGSGSRNGLDALATECREDGVLPPEMLRALAPLPETADELRRISRAMGGQGSTLLIGDKASEPDVRHENMADYRVLYFATHGLLPGELRCQSEPALALSPPKGTPGSKDEDGLLEASEIASMKLDADLVVLSACNTAAGGGKFGGEALSGLAESFFHAGARALLASHWQVPSAPTVSLMTGAFERVGKDTKVRAADALRQSQLALAGVQATSHPFYWAAFTLIGDGGGQL